MKALKDKTVVRKICKGDTFIGLAYSYRLKKLSIEKGFALKDMTFNEGKSYNYLLLAKINSKQVLLEKVLEKNRNHYCIIDYFKMLEEVNINPKT